MRKKLTSSTTKHTHPVARLHMQAVTQNWISWSTRVSPDCGGGGAKTTDSLPSGLANYLLQPLPRPIFDAEIENWSRLTRELQFLLLFQEKRQNFPPQPISILPLATVESCRFTLWQLQFEIFFNFVAPLARPHHTTMRFKWPVLRWKTSCHRNSSAKFSKPSNQITSQNSARKKFFALIQMSQLIWNQISKKNEGNERKMPGKKSEWLGRWYTARASFSLLFRLCWLDCLLVVWLVRFGLRVERMNGSFVDDYDCYHLFAAVAAIAVAVRDH